MWSQVKNWFTAPFSSRVVTRVPVRTTHVGRRVVDVGRPIHGYGPPVDIPLATHASSFLEWLQSNDGRTGDLFPRDLIELYRDFCLRRNWQSHYWQRVAHELAVLIGEGSKVTWVDGKKQRMWHIPQRVPPRVSTFSPPARQRVLGEMTTRVEAA